MMWFILDITDSIIISFRITIHHWQPLLYISLFIRLFLWYFLALIFTSSTLLYISFIYFLKVVLNLWPILLINLITLWLILASSPPCNILLLNLIPGANLTLHLRNADHILSSLWKVPVCPRNKNLLGFPDDFFCCTPMKGAKNRVASGSR